MVKMLAAANTMALRPFHRAVDMESLVLLLGLVLVVTGMWHLILERFGVELD